MVRENTLNLPAGSGLLLFSICSQRHKSLPQEYENGVIDRSLYSHQNPPGGYCWLLEFRLSNNLMYRRHARSQRQRSLGARAGVRDGRWCTCPSYFTKQYPKLLQPRRQKKHYQRCPTSNMRLLFDRDRVLDRSWKTSGPDAPASIRLSTC